MRKLASLAALRDGGIVKVSLDDGTGIVLVRQGTSVSAFGATCPHAGAPLEEGAICDGRLVCPWHKAIFRLSDGAIQEPPALRGLSRHETRIDGDDILVSLTPTEAEPEVSSIDGRQTLIIGSGAAGTAAAFALREAGYTGSVTMIGDESGEPYDRTALSKFVLNDMAAEDVPPLRADADWKRARIDRIEGKVVHLDAAARRVRTADGTELAYDTAIIATGATPRLPSIPGITLSGVHTLRDRRDAAFIAARAPAGSHAVIAGGGFIGLEAASALRQRGVHAVVVMPETIPLERQFGPEIGALVRRLHEANGVMFHAGARIERIEGTETVSAVLLESGERLPASIVIAGTGVTPATGFAGGLRKADDGGIFVDAAMRAAGDGTEGLYAAGDIACFPYRGQSIRIEHWRVAQQHGRIAASNIAGTPCHYDSVPFFWTYHFGRRFEYLGHASAWDSIHVEGDLGAYRFVAFQVRGGVVEAVIACQREHATAVLIEHMHGKLPLPRALDIVRAA